MVSTAGAYVDGDGYGQVCTGSTARMLGAITAWGQVPGCELYAGSSVRHVHVEGAGDSDEVTKVGRGVCLHAGL